MYLAIGIIDYQSVWIIELYLCLVTIHPDNHTLRQL